MRWLAAVAAVATLASLTAVVGEGAERAGVVLRGRTIGADVSRGGELELAGAVVTAERLRGGGTELLGAWRMRGGAAAVARAVAEDADPDRNGDGVVDAVDLLDALDALAAPAPGVGDAGVRAVLDVIAAWGDAGGGDAAGGPR